MDVRATGPLIPPKSWCASWCSNGCTTCLMSRWSSSCSTTRATSVFACCKTPGTYLSATPSGALVSALVWVVQQPCCMVWMRSCTVTALWPEAAKRSMPHWLQRLCNASARPSAPSWLMASNLSGVKPRADKKTWMPHTGHVRCCSHRSRHCAAAPG